ncbi:hypothetical protein TSAR_009788 [Trichomalopsis sarcophagae]|uniref:Transposable element P transposase-like RNase H C-terminal domain-containing protein n=1 Tax=Trichomalopsis sarcophagae TaxID=543379 RepID=A0A232EE37_9HYME|nr:hypothetical protein TSAR_009788 [Trichomalopsis sarcophagae]
MATSTAATGTTGSPADSLEFIKTWNCEDLKNNPPCFDGFYLTVNSILLQWEDMKKDGGFYLLTSRLNQDPLENLFAVLRSRAGHCQNPTAMQLRHNLQYTVSANIRSASKSTNCESDRTVPLLATDNIEKNDGFTEALDNAFNDIATNDNM